MTPELAIPFAPPALSNGARLIPIAEIFGPTIQGEGELIGAPTLFIRVGGCDYRCRWCDSLHAVLPEHKAEWTPMSAEQILAACRALAPPPILVTLSGGNPALYPLTELLALLHDAGYLVAIETQGSRFPAWLRHCDYVILSPKPPSSGERPDLASFAAGLAWLESQQRWPLVKIVIFDDADLDFAAEIRTLNPASPVRLSLSVGNPDTRAIVNDADPIHRHILLDRYEWLVGAVLKRGWHDVRILPQIHVLLWGNRRGV
jgi:7-carboxy-7-deazaguanine synthase